MSVAGCHKLQAKACKSHYVIPLPAQHDDLKISRTITTTLPGMSPKSLGSTPWPTFALPLAAWRRSRTPPQCEKPPFDIAVDGSPIFLSSSIYRRESQNITLVRQQVKSPCSHENHAVIIGGRRLVICIPWTLVILPPWTIDLCTECRGAALPWGFSLPIRCKRPRVCRDPASIGLLLLRQSVEGFV
jgi:hypothetical protein